VYNNDSTIDTWNQNGSDLVDDNSYDRFSKTAFSSDGTYLAVGAYFVNYVKLFAKTESNYKMIGEKMISVKGVRFGFSVDMSADEAAVAIGEYNCKGRAYLLIF